MRRVLSALAVLTAFAIIGGTTASGTTLSWVFKLDPSQVKYEESASGVQVRIDGYQALEYFEYPSLPYRVVSVLVPQGEDVSSYRLEIVDEARIVSSKQLGAYQGSERNDGTIAGVAITKAEAETEKGIFPKWQVRSLGSGVYRGYRIANFAFYPIRYDAASRSLIIEKEVRLVVETAPAGQSGATAERLRYVEGFRAQSRENVEEMVINPEAAGSYVFNEIKVEPGTKAFAPAYEPSMEGSQVQYLIVTNEAMAPAFQRLADWKTKKGIPAVVQTVEWIQQHSRQGADLAESVRNYIRDAYAKWGVEWVVLGGDTDVIPARLAYVSFYTGDFIPTDMYFSCLDGTWNADRDSLWGEAYHSALDPGDSCDLYAEVYLGRMPVSTLAEANTLVNKTINYSIPTDTLSKSKFLMLAEVLYPVPYHPGDPIVLDGAEFTQSVYNLYLNGNPNVTTTRLYMNYSGYPGSLPESKAATLDSMNAGTNHVVDVGHGYKYNMDVGGESILNYDADHLTNGQKLFAMYLMNCTSVAFDTDCLGEHFLRCSTGGAIGVTGSSRAAFPASSRPYMDQYYKLLFTNNIVQLGKLQTKSRMPFTPSAYSETADRWTHFIYNYLGDPETCIFQGTAKTFAVVKPSTAAYGLNNITIQVRSGGVPPDSAFVCLYKSGDDYQYASTDPTGSAVFNNFLCKSSGPIYVTVTGRNFCRYRDSIMVVSQTPAYLRVLDTTIGDTIVGNGDGTLDAGETVHLSVELKNTGQTRAPRPSATIRTSDAAVVVTDSTALYPSIAAGMSAWGDDDFRFSVGSSTPDQHVVEFTIAIRDSVGHLWSEKFAYEVHAPKLELYVNVLSDTLPYGNNNGVIEPGENFLIKVGVKNFGSGTAYGLTGKIRSLDPDIVVSDSDAVYNPIPLAGLQYGSGFVLSEATMTQVNYFKFILTDAYGRVFQKRMELRKPGAPTTLVLNSTYGPTEIHATWRWPDNAEAYRYQVYHSRASGGPYTLANKDLLGYTLFTDAGLLSSTRYYYVITAVDSCGNEGPRSVEASGTTSPPMMAGWPQKMGMGTASSVKIGDIDGDTHPEVVVGSDYIYAWHNNGIEVRDGDGQPLTWGVFNTYGSNYTATVALANLDGVAGLEIVAASWNTNQIYVFRKDGSVLPGWPKTTTYRCWASPVVGDIDGDGVLEVIAYDVGGTVYAWHANGTEVRDGDHNPGTDGVFFVTKNPGTWHISTPALADMDEDGKLDIIVCSPADSIYCLKWNGTEAPGWPVPVLNGANITASPAVGDINGDGHLEMVVQSTEARVYGLRHDGTSMTGWPTWVNCSTTTIAPSPALADLDGDGKLEVVIASLSSDRKVYIFKYNGDSYPGWPQTYSTSSTTESSPIIADIDGDGSLDIILGCEEGKLNAWNKNGQYIAGFPIQIGSYLRGTPVVCDLDLDGKLEIVTSCWDENVYVWDLPASYHSGCIQWNGFHANVYNTGLKDFVPVTAVGQISCVSRVFDDVVDLDWSVFPGVVSWDLYRSVAGAGFELLAASLHADQADLVSYVDRGVETGLLYQYRLQASGQPDVSQTTSGIWVPAVGMHLYQNHPNPFNPSTSIPFTVPGGATARQSVYLAVYDVNGALVKRLVSGAVPGGRHEVSWDGRNDRGESVASGVYFVQLSAGGRRDTRKMVLVR